jgi:predicted unusual protein kinase regulating ubiquinone biosynthesis (AarF/ABC1/UbiB family)
LSQLTDGLGDVARRFPLRIPTEYVLILRSLAILEGIALAADADFKIVDAAYPYVVQRLLTGIAWCQLAVGGWRLAVRL